MDNEILFQEHIEIQNLIKQINTDRFFGWGSWWITKLISDCPIGPTGHLLEDGHAAVANYILTHDSI